jgi:hypothetical protein
MQAMTKTLPELFAMLKVAEADIKKEHGNVLMVNKTTSFKKKGEQGRLQERWQESCSFREETQGWT